MVLESKVHKKNYLLIRKYFLIREKFISWSEISKNDSLYWRMNILQWKINARATKGHFLRKKLSRDLRVYLKKNHLKAWGLTNFLKLLWSFFLINPQINIDVHLLFIKKNTFIKSWKFFYEIKIILRLRIKAWQWRIFYRKKIIVILKA